MEAPRSTRRGAISGAAKAGLLAAFEALPAGAVRLVAYGVVRGERFNALRRCGRQPTPSSHPCTRDETSAALTHARSSPCISNCPNLPLCIRSMRQMPAVVSQRSSSSC